MQDVWATISGTTSVFPGDVGLWGEYLAGYAANRQWPRYYMSSVDMAAGMGRYRWTVVDDCLVVVKWMSMGGLKIFLSLPPMSKYGDIGAEKRVLQWFLDAGVGARLSDEDVALYNVPCTPCHTGPEFIYKADDYLILAGSAWAKWRYAQNVAQQYGVSVETTMQAMPADAVRLSKAWAQSTGKNASHEIRMASNPAGIPHGWTNTLNMDGTSIAWSAFQRITPNWVAYIASHRDTDKFQKIDASIYTHTVNMRVVANIMGSGCIVNMGGASGDNGLAEAKRKLRPCCELTIHRAVTARKITQSDWAASRAFAMR